MHSTKKVLGNTYKTNKIRRKIKSRELYKDLRRSIKVINKRKKKLWEKYHYEIIFLSCWIERISAVLTIALWAVYRRIVPFDDHFLLILSPSHSLLLPSLGHSDHPGIISMCKRHSLAVPSAWNSVFQMASWLMPSPPRRDLPCPYYLKFNFATSLPPQHS